MSARKRTSRVDVSNFVDKIEETGYVVLVSGLGEVDDKVAKSLSAKGYHYWSLYGRSEKRSCGFCKPGVNMFDTDHYLKPTK